MPRVFDARVRRFGGLLGDYEVGDRFLHWPGKTITEADDHLFCLLTMAVSPLHVDRHYAQTRMPEGRNVVIGTLIYAVLLGMSVPDISGRALANLGAEELRHVAPLYHGDTLYGSSEVLAIRPSQSRPDAGILTVRTTGTTQEETVVCRFTRSVLLPTVDEAGR